jgi:hypothetical protein
LGNTDFMPSVYMPIFNLLYNFGISMIVRKITISSSFITAFNTFKSMIIP